MPFNEQLPQWDAPGVEPPASKKSTGWQAGEKPPADYWNWQMHRTYKALEELQQKAAEKEDVATKADLAAHTAATTGVHGATSAATPNTIVQRDPDGRFKAAAPSASDDVARKDTVDNATAALRGAAPGTLDTLAKLAQAINNDPNFAATINAALAGKLDKTGGIVTGDLALHRDANGNLVRFRVRNTTQYVDIGAFWEEGVAQFAQIQSADVVAGNPQALRLNPYGGLVTINDYVAWHSGNNPANIAARGYQKFASGLILQWGYDTITGGSTTFTLPIAYPTSHLVTIPVAESSDPNLNVTSGNYNLTQFTAWVNDTNPVPIRWISIGV